MGYLLDMILKDEAQGSGLVRFFPRGIRVHLRIVELPGITRLICGGNGNATTKYGREVFRDLSFLT